MARSVKNTFMILNVLCWIEDYREGQNAIIAVRFYEYLSGFVMLSCDHEVVI